MRVEGGVWRVKVEGEGEGWRVEGEGRERVREKREGREGGG